MRRVGNSLARALGNEDVLRTARAQRVFRRWPEIVGDMLAERSHPDRYTKGTVWVAVQGSSWAQELRMMKDRILSRMREVSGEPGLFVDVRFGVRPLPAMPEEPPEVERVVEEVHGLTIGEIAKRRIENWPTDANGD